MSDSRDCSGDVRDPISGLRDPADAAIEAQYRAASSEQPGAAADAAILALARTEAAASAEESASLYAAMGNRAMGLNIALGDLDEKDRGAGNFGNFHHEDWFAGAKDVRTQLRHFGTLWIMK